MLVAGCGGGTSATGNAAVAPTTSAPGNGAAGAAGGAPAFPGATGLLAQINGQTLQVQGTRAQTAVTYSASTTFTNTVAAKLSDIVVGVCVQARSATVDPEPMLAMPGRPLALAERRRRRPPTPPLRSWRHR
jgi:hypothetical protein